jgi:replicative DNA helicase Mcm
MVLNASEQIEKFQDFISTNYEQKLHQIISQGKKSLIIDFQDLAKFDPELSEQLLENPEDIIKAIEISLEQFDIPSNLNIRIRIINLPTSQKILIKDIRSMHINNLMYLEGIVLQA